MRRLYRRDMQIARVLHVWGCAALPRAVPDTAFHHNYYSRSHIFFFRFFVCRAALVADSNTYNSKR